MKFSSADIPQIFLIQKTISLYADETTKRGIGARGGQQNQRLKSFGLRQLPRSECQRHH
jgi:hypothetical protein